MVIKYSLDGVDIDDEYSTCYSNDTSLIMLAADIKSNPQFKGKLLTKALYADAEYFAATYNGHHLSDYLEYGWEMSYDDPDFSDRLRTYLSNRMTSDKLMLGGWTANSYPSPSDIGNYSANNQLSGVMVYDIKHDSTDYLSQIAQGEYN